MLSTIVTIFVFVFLIFVGACIYDAVSNSTRQAERKEKEMQKADEARKKYPTIKNWDAHPLYESVLQFLIEKIDYFIQCAKNTKAGRDARFRLTIGVKPEGVYITSDIQDFTFYYSSIGYDNIKVGYYEEETNEACNDFAIALSSYLKKHYINENIDVSDVNYFIDPEGYCRSSINFWIDLSNLMHRLKQISYNG